MLRTRFMWVASLVLSHSVSWLSLIPLWMCTASSLMHSSLDGNFIGFQVFALVTGGKVQLWRHVSL